MNLAVLKTSPVKCVHFVHLPIGPVNNITAAVEDVGVIIVTHKVGSHED